MRVVVVSSGQAEILARIIGDRIARRDLARRGENVVRTARSNLNRNPRRINTGKLASDIKARPTVVGINPAIDIGTSLYYARWVHDGTGIYGPRGGYIYPRRARMLSWVDKGGSRRFAKRVRGMEPNHFLRDALQAGRH